MSYQVLARKWRPQNFSELVGQQQTAQALKNALENQRLHHAYLFTGTRGVGKTTIARILSKSLNCEKGISENPCGECSSCVEISQGNFVDLLEIDAASKTKVEDTRELLDNVQYRPTRGRYKVYLIDEVHMLSGHSFNALLKTLEEPPPHVIFLLATTDPQKMPVTVLSRCLQFHLRRMEEAEIISHLTHILNAENIACEDGALEPIAKGADGSMRDALSLLDQAIAYCGGDINTQTVLDMLGAIDKEYSFQLIQALLSDDANQLMQVIESIAQFSPDYDELLTDWLSLLHQLAVCQATGHAEDSRVRQLSEEISAADLQLFYQLSLHAKKDLAYTPHPRQGFEMAMLRILTFKPKNSPGSPGNKTKNLNQQNQQTTTPASAAPANNQESAQASQATTSHLPPRNLSASNLSPNSGVSSNSSAAAASQLVTEQQVQSEKQVNKVETAKIQEPVKPEPVKPEPVAPLKMVVNNTQQKIDVGETDVPEEVVGTQTQQEKNTAAQDDDSEAQQSEITLVKLENLDATNWYHVVAGLKITGQGLQVLVNSTAEYAEGGVKISALKKVEPLLTKNAADFINNGLAEYFDAGPLKLDINFVDSTSETPRERLERLHELAIDDAERRLLANPQIKYLMENLNATLARESIQLMNEG